MKFIHFSPYLLCMLVGASLCMQPLTADEAESGTDNTATEETATEDDGNSQEKKRAMLAICQKQVANELKDFRQLTNMLKKAKNERDYKKINKMTDTLIKKYSPLYSGSAPVTINGLEVTVEDLKAYHVISGSKRKKLYKDFVEFYDKQQLRQNRSRWGASPKEEEDSKKKPTVELNMNALQTIKGFLQANQEEFASKLDEEMDEQKQKNERRGY